MRTIRATELARQLGISRRTMSDICKNDPGLAFKRNRAYYIRLTELAKRPGFDIIDALLAPHGSWIKAVKLAKMAGIPRKTMSTWCRTRPNFAKRIWRIWYVDLEQIGANEDQIKMLRNGNNVSNLGQITSDDSKGQNPEDFSS